MATTTPDTGTLTLTPREPEGSRSARRLRREGAVPGVLYGGDDAPRHFTVDARLLRHALASAGQILRVTLDGAATSVLAKDVQRHPVRGEVVHVDFLRVRMDEPITSTVPLELTGSDAAPGVVAGGVFTQELRELAIEALPRDLPDVVTHDVSDLELNATVTLDVLTAPPGVTLLDDPGAVIATITPPTAEPTDEEIETETEVVGDAAVESPQAQGDTAEEAAQKADSAGS